VNSSPTSSGSVTAAFTQTVLPASTPISSAQYHQAVLAAVDRGGKRPKIAEAFAGCIQRVLESAGIQTVGEAEKIRQNPGANKRVADGALQCLGSAKP
jgi:hypothetical protein